MEIIVFAILTLYLFFRLWSVLGTRTGNEKQVDLFKHPLHSKKEDNIIVLSKHPKQSVQADPSAPSPSVIEQAGQLIKIDKSFNPSTFARHAKAAFSTITKAYVEANHLTLKRLLNTTVYEQFSAAIEERERKGLRQESEIDNLEAEIETITVLEDRAQITMRFTSQQIIATFNEEGQSFDNPSRLPLLMKDLWTFERLLSSKSPTWLLIRTEKA